jgi:hypothetical protein
MKLISETLVSRSSMEMSPAYWKPVLRVNYGTERRYRRSPWDFLGLFDKRETEWENDWVTTQIVED